MYIEGGSYSLHSPLVTAPFLRSLSCVVVSLVVCSHPPLQFGNTALMIASNQGDFLKVKALCEQKADVNKQDKYGQTALIFASFSGYQDIVELLLRYKALPDIQTKFGQTALMKVRRGWGRETHHIHQHHANRRV